MPDKADLGKATWLGAFKTFQNLVGSCSGKKTKNMMQNTNAATVGAKKAPGASKEKVKGYRFPGDAVTHSYQSLPSARGNWPRRGRVSTGGCPDIMWRKE